MITTDMRKPIPKNFEEVLNSDYQILIWNDFNHIFYFPTPSGYFWNEISEKEQ
jgi:hypothetical protein